MYVVRTIWTQGVRTEGGVLALSIFVQLVLKRNMGTDHVDLGRFKVTGNSEEIGEFKTPILREIARTAPYMNDGRFTTLREVVEFYNRGGIKNPHQDSLVIPLELCEQERLDLVEFLQSLNGEGWQTKPPE
jgi:cytochrome c peroxidase